MDQKSERGILWLQWARKIQALSQTGLAFNESQYDRMRYQELSALAAEIIAEHTNLDCQKLQKSFSDQYGYATPKVDVRGAVFHDNQLLLAREIEDDKWTLPGGWCDVNESPSENVIKEVWEETGFRVKIIKLAAVLDRSKHAHIPVFSYHVYKMFFICEIIGGEAKVSNETSEIKFFELEKLPQNDQLSVARVLDYQLDLMIRHWREPSLPTEFD